MKLQLDTEKKIIKIEEKVNFGELVEMLNKLFPNGEWKEFDLDTNLEIKMESTPTPITINEPFKPYRNPWWERQEVIYAEESNYTLKSGLFNVDLVK